MPGSMGRDLFVRGVDLLHHVVIPNSPPLPAQTGGGMESGMDSDKIMRTHTLSNKRKAQLMGIALWSAHWHSGQWSRAYRIGCRAQSLIRNSSEIGQFLFSSWFDALEGYVTGGNESVPDWMSKEFADTAKRTYVRLETFMCSRVLSAGGFDD